MKLNKNTIGALLFFVVLSVIYRVMPYRVDGFVPQLALGIFSGFLFSNNKKYAFAIPLISMLLSDIIYQVLYINNYSTIKGFYGWWQIAQYASIVVCAAVGFYIKKANTLQVGVASVAAPTVFFLLSNFFVWVEGMGFQHSYSFGGLIKCIVDGIPFYKASIVSTLIFSGILFGTYYLINQTNNSKEFAK